jgi:hypothetical protein
MVLDRSKQDVFIFRNARTGIPSSNWFGNGLCAYGRQKRASVADECRAIGPSTVRIAFD